MAFSLCVIPSAVRLSDEGPGKEATKPEIIALYVFGLIFSVYVFLCIWSLFGIIKHEEKRIKNYQGIENVYIVKAPE